jgi:hypothetical protein
VLDEFEGYNQPCSLTLDEAPLPVYDSAIKETANKKSVKKGGTVTYTVTLKNTGTVVIDKEWVSIDATKPHREASAAKQVQYLSVKTTQGSCHTKRFYTIKGAQCFVGRLDPGRSVVVTAKVKVSQPITHWAFLDYAPGTGEPPPDDNPKNDQATVQTKLKK